MILISSLSTDYMYMLITGVMDLTKLLVLHVAFCVNFTDGWQLDFQRNPFSTDSIYLRRGNRRSQHLPVRNSYYSPKRNPYFKSPALNMMVNNRQEPEYLNAQQQATFRPDGYRHNRPLPFGNSHYNPNRGAYLKNPALELKVNKHEEESEYAYAQQQNAFLLDGYSHGYQLPLRNNHYNPNRNAYFKNPALEIMVDNQQDSEYANVQQRGAFLLDGNRHSRPLLFGKSHSNPNSNAYFKNPALNMMVDNQQESEYANAQQHDAFLMDSYRHSYQLPLRNSHYNPNRNAYFKNPALEMKVNKHEQESENANAQKRDAFFLDGYTYSQHLPLPNNHYNPNRDAYFKSSALNMMVEKHEQSSENTNAQQRDAFLLDGFRHSYPLPFGKNYNNPNRNPFIKSPALNMIVDNNQEAEYARSQQRASFVRAGLFPRHITRRSKTFLPVQETNLFRFCVPSPCVPETVSSGIGANYGRQNKQHDTYDSSAESLIYDTQRKQIIQFTPSKQTHNVGATSYQMSMQRPDVASTLVRRCFNTVCLLGNISPHHSVIKRKGWSQNENPNMAYTKRSINWIRTRYGYWYYPYSYFDSRGPLDTLASQLIG